MPTTNPVPSTDPTDLLFNAGVLDAAVNGSSSTYQDRFGNTRMTVSGATSAILADVATVESSKNTAVSDMAADVATVESAKTTAVSNISADTATVGSAKSSAITSISADVAYVGGVADLLGMYVGASATDPTTRVGGASLQNGDFYLNTGINRMKAYANGSWYATETLGATDSALVDYTSIGTGAVETTVQNKLREFVSVKDFGAIGNGIADDRLAFQLAFDYVNSVGGGVVYIPPGRYRKSDTAGGQWTMYSNTTLRGAGDSSVIFWDDTDSVPRSGNDLLFCSNTVNVAFENFKIEGTALTYTNQTNQKQTLAGSNIDGLRVVNVTIEKVRYMATAFSYAKNVYMAGNRLDYVVRDGLRCTNSENVIITGNTLRRVCDDAIAVHTLDSATTPGSGVVITNNTLEACQGIRVLGAKAAKIRGNVIRRALRSPISIMIPAGGTTEGNTPLFAIDVSANTITDAFGNLGTNTCILIKQGLARNSGGLSTIPGVTSIPYAYNYVNNIDNGTSVVLGQFGIKVCDNTVSRTLPDGVAYSTLGYGQLFDRVTAGFLSDPTLTGSSFATHGVSVVGPASSLQIAGNIISGMGTGQSGILFEITGTANKQDFADTVISNNMLTDCPGGGFTCTALGSGEGAKHIEVKNNIFNIDPYFRNSLHNTDNTWSSSAASPAMNIGDIIGIVVHGNTFKNCSTTGISFLTTVEPGKNIVYADFVGGGDNAGNKGVRVIPSSATNIIIPIDGNPLSSTFGQIANNILTRSSVMPTSGRYIYGHKVVAEGPALQGSAGNRYMIFGWWRASTGNNHVLNTDWFELRALTGT